MKKEIPIIGYCDICGTVTSTVAGGLSNDVQADNRMEVYVLRQDNGEGKRYLCYAHYWQEVRNNMPINKTQREHDKEKWESDVLALFPRQRLKPSQADSL